MVIPQSAPEFDDLIHINVETPPNEDVAVFMNAMVPGSFSEDTVKVRLPVILTRAIDTLSREIHEGSIFKTDQEKKDASIVIEKISGLKYNLTHGRPLDRIPLTGDTIGDAKFYNNALDNLPKDRNTYFTSHWVIYECHTYRLIQSFLSNSESEAVQKYDIFFEHQKKPSFIGSVKSILDLVNHLHKIIVNKTENNNKDLILLEFLQFCLWGNKSDLSLLHDISNYDMHKMQAGTSDKLQLLESHIIVNKSKDLINYLNNDVKDGLIIFILDNSGFELFGDLCLADWLINKGIAKKIIFYGKCFPWFVSDVTEFDFYWTIDEIANLSKYIDPSSMSDADSKLLKESIPTTINRWKSYISNNQFEYKAHPFFTTFYNYSQLPEVSPKLFKELSNSDLVIFKGDLNYRKLVRDVMWKDTTISTKEACGNLLVLNNDKSSWYLGDRKYITPPFATFRTCKSEPLVGLNPGKEQELSKGYKDNSWRLGGSYGIIEFVDTRN